MSIYIVYNHLRYHGEFRIEKAFDSEEKAVAYVLKKILVDVSFTRIPKKRLEKHALNFIYKMPVE